MSDFLKCDVCFRICDDNLDPLEITEMLGIEPEKSHRKGDPTRFSKNKNLIKFSTYSSGLWSISSTEAKNAILEVHIKSLLVLLEPLKAELSELSKRGYEIDLFCGIFTHDCDQPGFDIDSSVLKNLGELNISIGMCIY